MGGSGRSRDRRRKGCERTWDLSEDLTVGHVTVTDSRVGEGPVTRAEVPLLSKKQGHRGRASGYG